METSELVTLTEMMPSKRFAGLWDSIIVDQGIKDRLLRSALLGLRLRAELPFEVTALHGLAVLHGPPGTGKTTLARGLACELAPLMKDRRARLIEVNPHGLMSAEHGQSQRKVSELLSEHIPSLADDGVATVVLLDEVESMAVARSEASLAANPADVHRATDAVLSALDTNATAFPHVVWVATSNFTQALDTAFLSRADLALELPLPDAKAATAILRSILSGMATAFPKLSVLAKDAALDDIGHRLAGTDGRRIRKVVTEAMLTRFETVTDPGTLTIADLRSVTGAVVSSRNGPTPRSEEIRGGTRGT